MQTGDERGRAIAELAKSSPILQPCAAAQAIHAMQSHPRFSEAIRHVLNSANGLYDNNGLLNRAANDRGRLIGGMIALYLHVCSLSEAGEPGFTVRAFQTFCVELKLCSFGRARALLTLMCFTGHLTPARSLFDKRQRRLVPTRELIELQRRRWRYQLEAIALMSHRGRSALEAFDQPALLHAFIRHLGATFTAGYRLLDHAPELSRLAERSAGLRLIGILFLSAADRMMPDGTGVPVSISALSVRFGVSRAHVRKLLAEAAAAGLLRQADASAMVIVLPGCIEAVNNLLAALFCLVAHCAGAAIGEMAGEGGSATR